MGCHDEEEAEGGEDDSELELNWHFLVKWNLDPFGAELFFFLTPLPPSLLCSFAVFCDQLGDYLEGILQSLLDVLERLFASDSEDEAHRLRRVPCQRATEQDLLEGIGPLRICTCPICLEDWRLGDEVRVLPACKHAFHRKCVDGWLSHGALCRHECPMCRTPVRLR